MSHEADREEHRTTYELADGKMIADQYGSVDSLDWFNDDYDPIELVERKWIMTHERFFTHHPNGCFCQECRPEDYEDDDDE